MLSSSLPTRAKEIIFLRVLVLKFYSFLSFVTQTEALWIIWLFLEWADLSF
jgi:hypothetical protein